MQESSEKRELFYLSGHIFNKNNKLYWEEDGKNIKINKKNWKKYINDLGWDILGKGWNQRFKKILHISKFNSYYCIKDCGEDGDCLFLCVAHAFNNSKSIDNHIYEDEIRKKTSEGITENNYKSILESYILEKNIGDFEGMWDPYTIENREELCQELIKSGNNFWGDHICIQLLSKVLNLNFIILNSPKIDDEGNLIIKELEETYNIHSLGLPFNKSNDTIILYFLDQIHFQLVGFFNGNTIKTTFKFNELPLEIIKMYQIDCRQDITNI